MRFVPATWIDAITTGALIGTSMAAVEHLYNGDYGKLLVAAAIGVAVVTFWRLPR